MVNFYIWKLEYNLCYVKYDTVRGDVRLLKRRNKISNLYLLISWGGVLSFVIVLLFKRIDISQWLVMEHNYQYQFSDFFRQIVYASDLKNIYCNTGDAPFPPLAYLFFYVLHQINPIDVPIELKSWRLVQDYQFNLLVYVMCMIIWVVFFVEIVKRILREYKSNIIIAFILSVLFSAPFMTGAIERGNISIVVCVLLLWAIYLKDSEIIWKKELALILIAIAASLKIYPAILGFIYLWEKRWKEAGKLLIYGILFFFVPFVFTGGVEGLKQYLKVLNSFENINVCRWTNIRSFLSAILSKCNAGKYQLNAYLGIVIENIYFIICLLSAFITKEKWKCILFLSGIMSLYVSNSYRYVAIYMVLPLVFWLEQQKGQRRDYVYCVLFALIFTIPTYGYFIRGEVDFFIFLPIYLVVIYSILETWFVKTHSSFYKIVVKGIPN